jgi:predicted ATP-grasp superfamily ATP-dependent carboligase
VEKEIERIGKTIARWGQLSGIFGVDLIIKSVSPPTDVATSLVVSKASSDSSDRATTFQVFVLEVNPRWTASVEILERATGENAFLLHQAACAQSPRRTPFARATSTLHGKLVVYAQEAFLVSAANSDRWVDRIRGRAWPALADIPRAGESIPAGAPICTVFASGLTMADVRAQLQAARAEIRSDLSGS